jgi:hypothetical protein
MATVPSGPMPAFCIYGSAPTLDLQTTPASEYDQQLSEALGAIRNAQAWFCSAVGEEKAQAISELLYSVAPTGHNSGR